MIKAIEEASSAVALNDLVEVEAEKRRIYMPCHFSYAQCADFLNGEIKHVSTQRAAQLSAMVEVLRAAEKRSFELADGVA